MALSSLLKWTALGVTAIALSACGNAEIIQNEKTETVVEAPAPASLAEVIAHPRRDADRPRDQFRNPLPTLEFFGVEPGKRVAEIWPGWYTSILAPYYAANEGTYVAVLYPEGVNERLDKRVAAFKEKFGDTETYGEIEYGAFLKDSGPILPAESVDVILTFRNVHNWMGGGYYDQAMNEFFAALKPGGTLGIVEHRLPEAAVQDPRGRTGYVQESYMKDAAKRAGFEFVASSEVNANPKDTADHPMGVWTLPPRSRLPKEGSPEAVDFNAELYKNIGESDRATLKFRKPVSSGG
jgi:predicted methyltransferase